MSITPTVELDGKAYVVIPRNEYESLKTLAKAQKLPPLPEPNERGNYPALEYARASLARKIIQDRAELGLNQRELARLSGVRVETLCRIETGKHTPSVASVDKIDAALEQARAAAQGEAKTPNRKGRGKAKTTHNGNQHSRKGR